MSIIAIYILGLVGIATVAYVWIDEAWKSREEKRLSAERLRRENSRIVALRKCGAEFVRIDRETEMNFTPFVNGVWPKPVKEGEIFLRCINGCKNFAECPIRKRLAEPVGCHEFGLADGVRVIKSSTFDKNGAAYFILHDDLEDRPYHSNRITRVRPSKPVLSHTISIAFPTFREKWEMTKGIEALAIRRPHFMKCGQGLKPSTSGKTSRWICSRMRQETPLTPGDLHHFPMSALVGANAAETLGVLEVFDVLLDRTAGNAKRRDHSREGQLRIPQ